MAWFPTKTGLLFFVLLLCFATLTVTFAQIQNITNSSKSDVQCPPRNTCYKGLRNLTSEWGHGNVCSGQRSGQCYQGDTDPEGTILGPRQNVVLVNVGDGLNIKTSGYRIKLYNVSRSSFSSCIFNNDEVIFGRFSSNVQIPMELINKPGVTYIIAESDNNLYRCSFGSRQQLIVHSASACLNPSLPGSDFCSGKGICSAAGSIFNRTYSCVCAAAYTGSYCQELNSCYSNPCLYGGTCVDKPSGMKDEYECKCIFGYIGKRCETNPDDCKDKPCDNGGICVDGLGTFTCLCPPGYNGKNCSELKPNPCEPNPCENGGTCSLDKQRHNYTCECTDGFEGRNCKDNATIVSSAAVSSVIAISSVAVQSTQVQGLTSLASVQTSHETQSLLSNTASQETIITTASQPSSAFMTSTMAPSSSFFSVISPSLSVSTLPTAITLSITPLPSLSPSLASEHISISATHSLETTTITSSVSVLETTSTLMESLSTGTISWASLQTSSLMSTMQSSQSIDATMALSSSTVFSTVPNSYNTIFPGIQSTVSMTTSTSADMVSSLTGIIPSMSVTKASSSTVHSSSVTAPTTIPPTTVPLQEQTCQDKPCNSGTCLDKPDSVGFNFTCICPHPTYGPRCSKDFNLHFPRFGNGSYIKHKGLQILIGSNNKIVISFKTIAQDGLLFYSSYPNRKNKDFIQLYLKDGKLKFRFDPGDGLVEIESDDKVNTGISTTAVMTYNSNTKNGTLQVDNNRLKWRKSFGKSKGIGLYNFLYIGGLPAGVTIGVYNEGKETSTFYGCIKDLEINNQKIMFTSPDAVDWHNINECDKPCDHQPCHNHGNCTNDLQDPHDFKCSCPSGFTGQKCDKYSVCSGDPCKGGKCIVNEESGTRNCLCPYGRVGMKCEKDVNITIPCFSMAYNHSSYIQYQTPREGSVYFAISLQFTIKDDSNAAQNSLLVFAGQENTQAKSDDYIALGILNNKIVLEYNLGTGSARITSDVLDSKLQWHSVLAGRDLKNGFLFVDSQSVKRGTSSGAFSGLNLKGPLYIGGVDDFADLESLDFNYGFEGCMSNIQVKFGDTKQFITLGTTQTGSNGWNVITGRNIVDQNYSSCDPNPCQNNGTCVSKGSISCSCTDGWKGEYCSNKAIPCVNHNPCAVGSTCRQDNDKAVCDCPLGKTGPTCAQSIKIITPQFKENSYMSFSPSKVSKELSSDFVKVSTTIKMTFTPAHLNGLMFYVGYRDASQTGDFLSISLHNGFVHYRYDLGSGVANLQSKNAISLNKQHTIEVTRTKQDGTLKVNSEDVIKAKSPLSFEGLDVKTDYYVGGVPQLSSVNNLAVVDSSSLRDYVGCIESVSINKVSLVLTETGAKAGRNIDNCPQSTSV